MIFFTDRQDLDAYTQELAQLILIGGYQFASYTSQLREGTLVAPTLRVDYRWLEPVT